MKLDQKSSTSSSLPHALQPGHYKLKLENSTDFAVAQQLLLLDRWECVVNRRNGRQDVLQLEN